MTGWLADAGASMLRFLDAYTLRARLFPAILGAAPALAAVLLLVSWKSLELSNIVATIAMLVLVYALADWARKRGQDTQPRIYEQMGGKPSMTMMY
jgi:membrane protein implicated in regulation of membrane protease activity